MSELSMPDKNDEGEKRIAEAIKNLGEWYDTVQIFCTRYNEDSDGATTHICEGTGNIYARFGQVELWAVRQRAFTQRRAERQQDAEGND